MATFEINILCCYNLNICGCYFRLFNFYYDYWTLVNKSKKPKFGISKKNAIAVLPILFCSIKRSYIF